MYNNTAPYFDGGVVFLDYTAMDQCAVFVLLDKVTGFNFHLSLLQHQLNFQVQCEALLVLLQPEIRGDWSVTFKDVIEVL